MRAELKVLVMVGAAALLTACGKAAEAPAATQDTAATPASTPAATAPKEDDDQGEAAEHARKALAALPAPYNTADLDNGQREFALCRSCHTITEGGPNMTGPNLYGLFGRTAGTAPKFNYSQPVKTAGFAWDADHLDKWLTDPRAFLPGNRMTFVGVKDPKDRADVIAYLMVETVRKSDHD